MALLPNEELRSRDSISLRTLRASANNLSTCSHDEFAYTHHTHVRRVLLFWSRSLDGRGANKIGTRRFSGQIEPLRTTVFVAYFPNSQVLFVNERTTSNSCTVGLAIVIRTVSPDSGLRHILRKKELQKQAIHYFCEDGT